MVSNIVKKVKYTNKNYDSWSMRFLYNESKLHSKLPKTDYLFGL